ncbi:GntR family transcriptional regulator [Saccharopolyspora sp. NPDC050642]|uniref:GntR family transcriptional regulator n=1 Tax=Saccharopolyspora sp. NPDC050642 TaxID=3157099 RepID=UPI003401533B
MPAEPRYLAIAAELRRRIAQGEPAPGAKVPSTRRIAAEWGVAAATAAKALAALRQEGLIRAEPRSGYVVEGSSRPAATKPAHRSAPHGRPEDLTRGRIVQAAIEIADNEGLAVLSMRGVAARLGVAPMSPNRRHPWLAQLTPITRPLPLPNLAVHAEFALAALDGLNLGAAAMCDLHVLLVSHVQGIAVHLEREQQALGASGLSEDEWMDNQAPSLEAITGTGRYPTFTRMLTTLSAEGYDLILDDLFELGLRSLLDGLAIRICKSAGSGELG